MPTSTVPAAASPLANHLTLARQHYENFPVGSWLLPARARKHLHRIYAFARTADDLADEVRDAPALAAFRAEFLRHLERDRGTGHDAGGAAGAGPGAGAGAAGAAGAGAGAGARDGDVPLFRDLAETIRECALERRLFTDLLDAFAQDCVQRRYDLPQLLDYCRRSANPIGRLVLRVHGLRDAALDALSDRVCTALQLLNHLQDLRSDLRERDRVYFPREDLERFGVSEPMLLAASASPQVRALVRHWAARLAADFAAGWPLVERVRGRLRWELRAILRGAAAVLARIAAVDGDVLGGRVHLTRGERLRAVLAGLCRRRAPAFAAPGATA